MRRNSLSGDAPAIPGETPQRGTETKDEAGIIIGLNGHLAWARDLPCAIQASMMHGAIVEEFQIHACCVLCTSPDPTHREQSLLQFRLIILPECFRHFGALLRYLLLLYFELVAENFQLGAIPGRYRAKRIGSPPFVVCPELFERAGRASLIASESDAGSAFVGVAAAVTMRTTVTSGRRWIFMDALGVYG